MKAIPEKLKNIFVIGLIVAIGLILNRRYLKEFPPYNHTWAQSDRYAIALGFLDNGLDLFHPQTYVYNKQFPGDFKTPSNNTITSVDFPIHDYIAACIMKLLNTKLHWCFSLYMLLYSFIGLFFLYKLAVLSGNNLWQSVFILVFACSSPVFVCYQTGFLPSIPSLANALIGFYLYFKHIKTKNRKYIYWAVFFLTLATLSRTTFLLFLSSILAFEFLIFIKNRKIQPFKILTFIFAFSLIAAFFLYNKHLGDTYGSMFLNKLLPPQNFDDATRLLQIVYENWFFHYFTIFHYLALVIILIIFVLAFFKKAKNKINIQNPFVLIIICFAAAVCFLIVMMKQFKDHDYYFLDTFFLPVLLLLTFAVSRISGLIKIKPKYLAVILIAVSFLFIGAAKQTQKNRDKREYWDRTWVWIKNYKTSSEFINSVGIPKDAKILVVDAYAPNLPFILMERTGFNTMGCSEAILKNSFSWDYDYLIAQTEFLLPELYKNYPDFINQFEGIAENGYLFVFKKRPEPINSDLESFLGIKNQIPYFSDSIDFEWIHSENWSNVNTFRNDSISAKGIDSIGKTDEFGLTFRKNVNQDFSNKSTVLKWSAKMLVPGTDASGLILIASIQVDNKNVFYQGINLSDRMDTNQHWQERSFYILIPATEGKKIELSVYLWNTMKKELYIENAALNLYRLNINASKPKLNCKLDTSCFIL